jgi:hypothetical protein
MPTLEDIFISITSDAAAQGSTGQLGHGAVGGPR